MQGARIERSCQMEKQKSLPDFLLSRRRDCHNHDFWNTQRVQRKMFMMGERGAIFISTVMRKEDNVYRVKSSLIWQYLTHTNRKVKVSSCSVCIQFVLISGQNWEQFTVGSHGDGGQRTPQTSDEKKKLWSLLYLKTKSKAVGISS